jgi:hypothetical protein
MVMKLRRVVNPLRMIRRKWQTITLLFAVSSSLNAQMLHTAVGVQRPDPQWSGNTRALHAAPMIAPASGKAGIGRWIMIGALSGAVIGGGVAAFQESSVDDSFGGGQLVIGGVVVGAVGGALVGALFYAMNRSQNH